MFQQAMLQQQQNQAIRHRYDPSSSSLAGALGPMKTPDLQARISPAQEQQPTRPLAPVPSTSNIQGTPTRVSYV